MVQEWSEGAVENIGMGMPEFETLTICLVFVSCDLLGDLL